MSLTRRSLIIVLFIALLAIVGQWSGAELRPLWRYPTALLLFGLLLEGLRARVHPPLIRQKLNPQLALGETQHLSLEINNPSSQRLEIQAQPRYSDALCGDESPQHWTLAANDSLRCTALVTPVSLGNTGIGQLYTRVLGHLGLAWWSRTIISRKQSRIVPRGLSRSEHAASQLLTGERYTPRRFSSGDNLLALRDYQAGDPIRSIDWKATARRGQTTVRVYARAQSLDLMLVIDAGRSSRLRAGQLTRLNHSINIAARLAQLASTQGDQIGLLGFTDQRLEVVPLGHGARTLQNVRSGLERLYSREQDFNPITAALEIQKLLRQRCLIVFLCELEQHEAAEQLAKACTLLTPKHLPLVASLIDTDVQAFQQRACTDWLDPYRRYAAYEFSRSQQATALHLRRLNTEVVLGTPGQLDQRVIRRYRLLRNRQRV